MIAAQVVGWFALGFAVAAVLFYGPVMAQAYWVKKQAIDMMKEANKQARELIPFQKEYTEMQDNHIAVLKDFAKIGKEHGDLQEKYITVLDKFNGLQAERIQSIQDAIKTAKEYGELQKKYAALLEKYDGKSGSEGTT